MSEVRFYADEHIPKAVVHGLRQRGINILSVAEADRLGAEDIMHLQFALTEHRVIVTHDADFSRLASTGTPHAGIVYAPHQTSVGHMIQGLVLIHSVLTAEEMVGHVEFL